MGCGSFRQAPNVCSFASVCTHICMVLCASLMLCFLLAQSDGWENVVTHGDEALHPFVIFLRLLYFSISSATLCGEYSHSLCLSVCLFLSLSLSLPLSLFLSLSLDLYLVLYVSVSLSHYSQILYYQLEENVTPLGKTVYQCKLRGRNQLDADRVSAFSVHRYMYIYIQDIVTLDSYMYTLRKFPSLVKIERSEEHSVGLDDHSKTGAQEHR